MMKKMYSFILSMISQHWGSSASLLVLWHSTKDGWPLGTPVISASARKLLWWTWTTYRYKKMDEKLKYSYLWNLVDHLPRGDRVSTVYCLDPYHPH